MKADETDSPPVEEELLEIDTSQDAELPKLVAGEPVEQQPIPNKYKEFAAKYGALSVAIFSHIAFGLQPVFSRYLQNAMEHPLPSFSLITVGFGLNVIAFSPKLIYSGYKYYRSTLIHEKFDKSFVMNLLQIFYSDFIKNWMLWVYLFTCIARVPSNFYASRLTSAIYVQLIGLLSPFVISFLTFVFLRNTRQGKMDKLSWKTFAALIATILGCVMIILGGIPPEANLDRKWWSFLVTFEIEWSALGKGLTVWDAVGMGCAFTFCILLSSYMLMTQVLKMYNAQSASKFLTQGENLYVFQSAAVCLAFFLPSVIFEDWSPWLLMKGKDWLMFCLFILIVQFGAQYCIVFAIQRIGANTVGSTVSLRMVSAITFSAVVLGEGLSTIWQVVGAVVVLVSVSLFLYYQNVQQKRFLEQEKLEKEAEANNA
jgi:drug/metabolite transporter (DMT)-like permease